MLHIVWRVEVHEKERFFCRRHSSTEGKRGPEACRVLEEREKGEPSLGELLGKWVVLAARLLGDVGVRPSEIGEGWVLGRRKGNLGRRGKKRRSSARLK